VQTTKYTISKIVLPSYVPTTYTHGFIRYCIFWKENRKQKMLWDLDNIA